MLAGIQYVCRLTRPYRGKMELFESDLCGGKGEGRVPIRNRKTATKQRSRNQRPGQGELDSKENVQSKPADLSAPL
jgi:hypothetical protein